MVEVEAAQKILIRFAAAGMLRDDQAGDRLQNFSGTKNRTILNFLGTHRSLSRGVRNSHQIILAAVHRYGSVYMAHR